GATGTSTIWVVAKSLPLSQTSISSRIRPIVAPRLAGRHSPPDSTGSSAKEIGSPAKQRRQRLRRDHGRLAHEVAADIGRWQVLTCDQRFEEWQAFRQRLTMGRRHRHDDDKGEIARRNHLEQRVLPRAKRAL